MLRTMLTALAVSLAAMPQAVAAEEPTRAASESSLLETRASEVVAVLRKERPATDVFAATFLALVSEAQLHALVEQVAAQFGAFHGLESITDNGDGTGTVALRFERALVSGPIMLSSDSSALVSSLNLTSVTPIGESREKVEADLAALPGATVALFAPLDPAGAPVLSVDSERHMAVGSTFKFYVLAALSRSIAAGKHRWDETVPLDRRSLPNGILQDWPRGSPVTLHTLATLMISISDNTATDILMALLGRDAIEAELRASGHSDPARTLPLLSTLEMFALKGSAANMAKYIAADEAGRRRILADFEDDVRGDPTRIALPRFEQPTEIDTIEWFASPQDLRKLLSHIVAMNDETALSILTANPAMPENLRADWSYVGYKGGSEPGVLALTWLLRDKEGQWHILTLGWNNPDAPVDTNTLVLLGHRMSTLPRE